jgi:tetratricopeptide (TPR) repeat protein
LERYDVRLLKTAIATIAAIVAIDCATADDWLMPPGCDNSSPERRIQTCTPLIDSPDTAPDVRAKALFLRGLSFSQLNQRERAINDYDEAIRIDPQFASALNNRADAYLKMGQPAQGVEDIERALTIAPQAPIYNATRGQIGQALGDREGAIRDHEAAMAYGGPVFVRLYQCGLRLARLYRGPLDGVLRPELRSALRLCVDKGSHCDPVPDSVNLECPEPVA